MPEVAALPEQFGRYRIVKLLGQGGMGAVYLAHDTHLDRAVALKVPHFGPPHNGPEVLERFYREARAAAALRHPHICPVYDVGQIDRVHFLTMAYIEGQMLSSLLRDGPPLERTTAKLVRQLALALAEAHKKGVIHRDLKPSNVMLTPHDGPVIMDFGLARFVDADDARLTEPGAVVGTVAYMAPEQARGEVEAQGPACDVYSLGVILYELLCGRLPFQGPTLAVLAQILLQEPEPPSAHRPGLDRGLEAICLKAMAKKAADRFGSMTEFAAALDRPFQEPPSPQEPRSSEKGTAVPPPQPQSARPSPKGEAAIHLTCPKCGQKLEASATSADKVVCRNCETRIPAPDALPPVPPVRRNPAETSTPSPSGLATGQGGRPWPPAGLLVGGAGLVLVVGLLLGWFLFHRAVNSSAGTSLAADTSRSSDPPPGRGSHPGAKDTDPHPAKPTSMIELKAPPPSPPKGERPLPAVQRKEADPPPKAEQKSLEQLDKGFTNSLDMRFVLLPKGSFQKGGEDGRPGAQDATIPHDFYIGVHEVTQGQWEAVTGENPSHFSRKRSGKDKVRTFSDQELRQFPVESVSWNDVQDFIKRLNAREKDKKSGWLYRVPLGEEWEYACRGGATSPEECSFDFYFKQPTNALSFAQANFDSSNPHGGAPPTESLGRTTKVGSYEPNRLGIYDMHGNVMEWCEDPASPDREMRGGGWDYDGKDCRAVSSNREELAHRASNLGFRLALVPAGQ